MIEYNKEGRMPGSESARHVIADMHELARQKNEPVEHAGYVFEGMTVVVKPDDDPVDLLARHTEELSCREVDWQNSRAGKTAARKIAEAKKTERKWKAKWNDKQAELIHRSHQS